MEAGGCHPRLTASEDGGPSRSHALSVPDRSGLDPGCTMAPQSPNRTARPASPSPGGPDRPAGQLPATAISVGLSFPDSEDPQRPSDVAVIMPTVLRPVILRAVRSIYHQDFAGRIQILIGVDRAQGAIEPLRQLLDERPSHVSALILQLPWSTSVRHGGVHSATDSGSLRAILSFMANSRAVAYLDDDNEMMPDHISLLHDALQDKPWAWSLRLLVDERDGRDLAVDSWDSVGPDRGRISGGFVDTNCLMLDKVLCASVLGRWAETAQGQPGLTADRHLFAALRKAPYGVVNKATVRYFIRPTNILHQFIQSGRSL